MSIVYILAAILIFGILIAVHELGHFLAAKFCGVQVNEFSIGMGPALWKRQKGETLYSLRLLPIGGYCAMEGEDEDTGNTRSFVRQGFLKKLVILAAGAFMNFIAGLLIIAILFSSAQVFWVDSIANLAPEVTQTGASGLMPGDQIYKVNGWRTYFSGDAQMFLGYSGDTADIEVIRDGQHITVQELLRQTCTDQQGKPYQGFGLYVGRQAITATAWNKLSYSWNQAKDFVQLVWFSLVQLVQGNAGLNDLSGPVGIVTAIGQAASYGWQDLLELLALITINLGIFNLLPFPALDGGKVVFLIIEGITGRAVPEKLQSALTVAAFGLLFALMLFATYNDIIRLVTGAM